MAYLKTLSMKSEALSVKFEDLNRYLKYLEIKKHNINNGKISLIQ